MSMRINRGRRPWDKDCSCQKKPLEPKHVVPHRRGFALSVINWVPASGCSSVKRKFFHTPESDAPSTSRMQRIKIESFENNLIFRNGK
jgi:hypothetical protein